MATCKDALRWMVSLVLAAGPCGCAGAFLDRFGHPVTQAAPRLPAQNLRAGGDLSPDLRISAQQAGSRPDTGPPIKDNADPVKPSSAAMAGFQQTAGPPSKSQEIPADGNPMVKLRALYRDAADRYARISSYIVRLRRREQVNGKDHPEEVLLVKFRKNPWSIYFKWLGKEGNGREVIYVRGRYEDKIHTLLAAGDIPLMPAGKRIALAPDNALVRSSSRHSIHEAGIGTMIDTFGEVVSTAERAGARALVKSVGVVSRPELAAPCEAVEQIIPPGGEPLLPRGGRRLWFFDSSSTKLPVLVITQDETGHEAEYYCYDRFLFPVDLDDSDFNPDELWKASKPPTGRQTPTR
jgi:hypothetical protein